MWEPRHKAKTKIERPPVVVEDDEVDVKISIIYILATKIFKFIKTDTEKK